MRRHLTLWAFAAFAAAPVYGQEDAPLSAIDWLSESVSLPVTDVATQPDTGTRATRVPDANEAPVAQSATIPDISVRVLDAPSPDKIGLLTPELTGFPATLWSGSEEAVLADLLRAERVDTLPAIQALLQDLILMQAQPPMDAGSDGALFLARIDKLLDLGALDPAQALLEAASPDTPQLFRRFFDVSLLTGREAAACDLMQERPSIAPAPAARIFCLARNGDWSAAVLTLNTARILGDIDAETAELVARFLDPDLFEDAPALAPPSRPSPLVFRMREAIGQGLPTTTLPRAFAHADLRPTTGWKAQLDAAERLARTGAIPASRLEMAYSARVPAASGGVWDRARAVQRLTAALESGDEEQISQRLSHARNLMFEAGLGYSFAELFAELIAENPHTGTTEDAFLLGLLTASYETAQSDQSADADFLMAVARGNVAPDMIVSAHQRPVFDAFSNPQPDPTLLAMAGQNRLGEAILRNIAQFDQGLEGDPGALSEAIATFRALGLEDVARRAALQYLILRPQ